jgi:hypothetical protein
VTSALRLLAEPRVEQVAQTVAEEVDPDHDEVVATRFRELWAS